jgi:hypothetical protein
VALLSYLVLQDPVWMQHGIRPGEELLETAHKALERLEK